VKKLLTRCPKDDSTIAASEVDKTELLTLFLTLHEAGIIAELRKYGVHVLLKGR